MQAGRPHPRQHCLDAVKITQSEAKDARRFAWRESAQHRDDSALADPCPEVLLARLGAETQTIRIGSGGVLLPYYSAFRVAETFSMLEALSPGRVDLGIGRAPGGDQRTAHAVGRGP